MSKYCPQTNEKVLYLDCLECDDRICNKTNKDTKNLDPNKQENENDFEIEK